MPSDNWWRFALFYVCAFLIVPFMQAATVFGEETAEVDMIVETKDVVISATKILQPLSQVTSAVEVIRGEELERKKSRQ